MFKKYKNKIRGKGKLQGGQALIFFVAILLTLVTFTIAVINTGHRVSQRVHMQTAVDSSALSSAAVYAKGMNVHAFLNLVIVVLQSLVVILQFIKFLIDIVKYLLPALCLSFTILCGVPFCQWACPIATTACNAYVNICDPTGLTTAPLKAAMDQALKKALGSVIDSLAGEVSKAVNDMITEMTSSLGGGSGMFSGGSGGGSGGGGNNGIGSAFGDFANGIMKSMVDKIDLTKLQGESSALDSGTGSTDDTGDAAGGVCPRLDQISKMFDKIIKFLNKLSRIIAKVNNMYRLVVPPWAIMAGYNSGKLNYPSGQFLPIPMLIINGHIGTPVAKGFKSHLCKEGKTGPDLETNEILKTVTNMFKNVPPIGLFMKIPGIGALINAGIRTMVNYYCKTSGNSTPPDNEPVTTDPMDDYRMQKCEYLYKVNKSGDYCENIPPKFECVPKTKYPSYWTKFKMTEHKYNRQTCVWEPEYIGKDPLDENWVEKDVNPCEKIGNLIKGAGPTGNTSTTPCSQTLLDDSAYNDPNDQNYTAENGIDYANCVDWRSKCRSSDYCHFEKDSSDNFFCSPIKVKIPAVTEKIGASSPTDYITVPKSWKETCTNETGMPTNTWKNTEDSNQKTNEQNFARFIANKSGIHLEDLSVAKNTQTPNTGGSMTQAQKDKIAQDAKDSGSKCEVNKNLPYALVKRKDPNIPIKQNGTDIYSFDDTIINKQITECNAANALNKLPTASNYRTVLNNVKDSNDDTVEILYTVTLDQDDCKNDPNPDYFYKWIDHEFKYEFCKCTYKQSTEMKNPFDGDDDTKIFPMLLAPIKDGGSFKDLADKGGFATLSIGYIKDFGDNITGGFLGEQKYTSSIVMGEAEFYETKDNCSNSQRFKSTRTQDDKVFGLNCLYELDWTARLKIIESHNYIFNKFDKDGKENTGNTSAQNNTSGFKRMMEMVGIPAGDIGSAFESALLNH